MLSEIYGNIPEDNESLPALYEPSIPRFSLSLIMAQMGFKSHWRPNSAHCAWRDCPGTRTGALFCTTHQKRATGIKIDKTITTLG